MNKWALIFVVMLFASTVVFVSIAGRDTVPEKSLASALPPAPLLQAKTFKVLIVPGHDPHDGGAKYKDIYERDLVAIIAEKIAKKLGGEKGYNVIVTRTQTSWNPIFTDYFDAHEKDILVFKNTSQAQDRAALSLGKKKYVPDQAFHANVTKEMAIKLYGINKWADENGIDLILNLHFNDSERKNMNSPGSYSGYTIFIPEKQLKNSLSSRLVAQNIYSELSKFFKPEVIGSQKDSILEDQSLIALGASDTLTMPSVLIEYGYIYEKNLRKETERADTLDKMATQTVAGIMQYVKKQQSNASL